MHFISGWIKSEVPQAKLKGYYSQLFIIKSMKNDINLNIKHLPEQIKTDVNRSGMLTSHRQYSSLYRSAVTSDGTDLYVLTSLDEFPHKRLQLIVPLDQIAQVGVQGLLWQTQRERE